MLKQLHRFHSRNGVRAVLHKGAHKSVGPFKVSVLPTRKHQDPPVAAVVVSKKVMKTAVGRNRIRRRVFSALERVWEELHQDSPLQVVVVCYEKELLDMPSEALYRDLHAAAIHAKERL